MEGTSFTSESLEADVIKDITQILVEQIELAKPDDLAFLEFQVERIAERIFDHLHLQGVLCLALTCRIG